MIVSTHQIQLLKTLPPKVSKSLESPTAPVDGFGRNPYVRAAGEGAIAALFSLQPLKAASSSQAFYQTAGVGGSAALGALIGNDLAAAFSKDPTQAKKNSIIGICAGAAAGAGMAAFLPRPLAIGIYAAAAAYSSYKSSNPNHS